MESQKIVISLVVLAGAMIIVSAQTQVSASNSAKNVTVSKLRCVQCESTDSKYCMDEHMTDDVAKNFTTNCTSVGSSTFNVCMKVVAETTRTSWTGKNGKREVAAVKVSRLCAMMGGAPNKCSSMDGAGGYITWCYCNSGAKDGRGCNSGANVVASLVLMALCYIAKTTL